MESSVQADWTILEAAQGKLREVCNLLKGIHLAGIARKTKSIDVDCLEWRARNLDEMMVLVAQQCASHLEWSRHVRYVRHRKRQYNAGTISYDDYWCSKQDDRDAMQSRINAIHAETSIAAIRDTCFPIPDDDLPF